MANYSKIQIINMALILLSAEQIVSVDAPVPSAKKAKVIWDITRDALLEEHPWNFAVKRVKLPSLTTSPSFEYTYTFELPTDWIKSLDLYPAEIEYKIEDNKLLCNEPSISLKYIARIEDTTKFTPLFADTLAAALAWRLAYPITQSSSVVSAMWDIYINRLSSARSADSQNDTPDPIDKYGNTWIDARL